MVRSIIHEAKEMGSRGQTGKELHDRANRSRASVLVFDFKNLMKRPALCEKGFIKKQHILAARDKVEGLSLGGAKNVPRDFHSH